MLNSAPPTLPELRPAPRRVQNGAQRGWYLAPDPATGKDTAWMRATTFAHKISDDTLIESWKRRKVAEGIAMEPATLGTILGTAKAIDTAEDLREAKRLKAELNTICDEAMRRAGAEYGAGWGTALHTATEWTDAGRAHEIEIPIDLLADLAEYTRAMDAAALGRPKTYIERIVINTILGTAGTFDRILTLPGGKLVIGDLKTQKTVEFGFLEMAVQLAQYTHAEYMLGTDGVSIEPMPPVDKHMGIIMHLPAGSARLKFYELDLEAGWATALLIRDVLTARGASKTMGKPWTPAPAETAQQLALDTTPTLEEYAAGIEANILKRINAASSYRELAEIWLEADCQGLWTQSMTEAATARKQQLGSTGK